MIYGVGVDIVDVERFSAAVARRGERLLARLFTDSELAYCRARRRAHDHLAARFAAKVSLYKALAHPAPPGPHGRRPRWRDVEVATGPMGRPFFRFTKDTPGYEGLRFSLTMAHDHGLSMAETVVERIEGAEGPGGS